MPGGVGLNTFPHVAFGEYTNAVPGSTPKSHGGWTGGVQIPMPIPPPITGWRAPGIPHPPPLPAVHVGPPIGTPTSTPGAVLFGPPIGSPSPIPSAVHVGPPIGTPTQISGQESSHGSPFQTPSSVQFTTPRVIPGPRSLNVQPEMQNQSTQNQRMNHRKIYRRVQDCQTLCMIPFSVAQQREGSIVRDLRWLQSSFQTFQNQL